MNTLLRFLFGKNFDSSLSVNPGTFYLDVQKNELWYDNPDPSNVSTTHNKIIDTSTLIFESLSTVECPSKGAEDEPLSFITTSGATTASLGKAVLGSMVLGTP